ncbi:MAG TPA: hypothetical protein VED46_10860 [Alphaproteobacteria bacterium]|nr:hypothetical protein [Alphaproteobacteria bacterium]
MSRIRIEEPPLDEMLADPIVRLVMRRDGIGPEDVLEALEGARRRFALSRRVSDASDRVLPAGI